jgi:hypothetical protein
MPIATTETEARPVGAGHAAAAAPGTPLPAPPAR